jgi:hypothetical protein
MGLPLAEIVPWGRNRDEYERMFVLSSDDQQKRILDAGGGPASFNAVWPGPVVSIDPVYAYSADQIQKRIESTFELIIGNLTSNSSGYLWEAIRTPRDLGEVRMAAMQVFLENYRKGAAGRYVAGMLPYLPFTANSFDLALCSHLLFTYSSIMDYGAHEAAALELLRLAPEVRIFPLIDTSGHDSPHLKPLQEHLESLGHHSEVVPVDYHFQRGANKMLRIVRRAV